MQLADLCDYPLLMLDKTSNSRKYMDMFLAGYGIDIKPAIELESLSLLSEFAKTGLGIAMTIKEEVQKMLDSGALFELKFNESLPVRSIGLAHMKNVSLSYAAEAFRSSVIAVMQ